MVLHAKHERNFHIFYQLIYGAEDSLLRDSLKLERNTDEYTYLQSAATHANTSCASPMPTPSFLTANGALDWSSFVDDIESFKEVQNALDICDFDDNTRLVSFCY